MIFPVLKKGFRGSVFHYRPISHISVTSKNVLLLGLLPRYYCKIIYCLTDSTDFYGVDLPIGKL